MSTESTAGPPVPHDVGAAVRQVVRPIVGTVADVKWDAQAKGFAYLVEFELDGDPGHRWFTEAEIEAQPAPEAA